ncbi:U-box domain-containing protein 34 isoform X1 [Arachis duranensis]|uniref:U-box domain-containing protein 34 isoform X1 n=1 Tax=Arachis duranensis TaxID=130453 RepID=A0A6P4DXA4_ARADU|nr:U-box domain-containing protein 34 isoform X1 [Arachis duranensis]
MSSFAVAGAEMRSVAVAVSGSSGCARGSRRAVQWAAENLVPQADRFILVHVIPRVTSIPTPSGECVPISEADSDVLAAYVQDVKQKSEEIFVPFKELCKSSRMETLLLEDDNPADALLSFISESGIQILVMGPDSSNFITRKLKGPGISATVLRSAPDSCDVYLVARDKIMSKLADSSSFNSQESSSRYSVNSQENKGESGVGICREMSGINTPILKNFRFLSISDRSYIGLQTSSRRSSFDNSSSGDDFEAISLHSFDYVTSAQREQLAMQEEVDRLQLELQNTIAMYKQACEDLAHVRNKTLLLSSESLEEAKRVHASLENEQTLRKVAAEEKEKYLKVMKELEEAKNVLAKESYERQIAELDVLKESIEKKRIVDTLISHDKRYRIYTMDEIKEATNFFSEDLVIGEGGYGKVYKCTLDHTPVAVKVLHPDAINKKEEFLKEVEILSQLHHPNMVLLLGACPDTGCLVYEYMDNGSLEDYIFKRNEKQPLPWFTRFHIVFEMACGLSFLHNTKPEPIVHRDIKPGNILLDRNYVSKIADVGLAKLLSDVVPDNVTEYRESMLAGTLHYMDPEYQRTGTVRTKSDVYAFGLITLQLITSRHARGLILAAEDAVMKGSLGDILDKSAGDWPLNETLELAQIALKCVALRCRDRPDLDTEVLPQLERLSVVADAGARIGRRKSIHTPSQYYCPILQEIMDDPHVAADGFTYEYRAIKAWLSRHNVSPVTKHKLRNSMLIPNHTLRSAIQEWKSGVSSFD